MTEKEFLAEIGQLDVVNAFVEDQLEQLECPMKAQMQIMISVEEIFVNIAHYAYEGGQGNAWIGIRREETGGITIRFRDRGIPFDPLAKADPDITLKAEDRKIGGLGILMVKKNMDRVEYAYENGQNVLTLWKNC